MISFFYILLFCFLCINSLIAYNVPSIYDIVEGNVPKGQDVVTFDNMFDFLSFHVFELIFYNPFPQHVRWEHFGSGTTFLIVNLEMFAYAGGTTFSSPKEHYRVYKQQESWGGKCSVDLLVPDKYLSSIQYPKRDHVECRKHTVDEHPEVSYGL